MISQRSSLNSASSEWMWLSGNSGCYVDMHCTITITSSTDVARLAGRHRARRERLRSLHQTTSVLDGVNCRITKGSRRCGADSVPQSHHGVALLLIIGQEFRVGLSVNCFDVQNVKVLYFVHVCFEHLCG